ncbi:MAG: hypothetical protein ABSD28_05000 [Tepidisphaeraceae bacterium]
MEVRPIAWNEYWRPFLSAADASVLDHLLALRESRAALIENYFSLTAASRFCLNYFTLLSAVLERVVRGNLDRSSLSAILALECFPIRRAEEGAASAVAATSNVRNPVYLLAKLRNPKAYDDAKFLPLITAATAVNPSVVAPPLFYYYRQFVIESRSGICLFAYPAVQRDDRAESFRCIELLTHGLSAKTDPRAARRASWIADRAIGPFLRSAWVKPSDQANLPIAIGDLGGGSGQLTRRVWDRLVRNHTDITQDRELFWHLIDLKPHNTTRFIRQRKFLRGLAELRCVGSDWKNWIVRCVRAPQMSRFHVLLLCRLFNNFSRFSVECVDDWHQVRMLSKKQLSLRGWKNGSYLPHMCLAEGGTGPSLLLASNARVRLGRTSCFVRLSLSDYFRGIHLLSRKAMADSGGGAVYFVARRFDDASLLLPDGQSALAALCSIGDLVIIEDVDFNARALRRHMEGNDLSDLAAADVTDRVRMQGTNLLCVSQRKNERFLPGRRIW